MPNYIEVVVKDNSYPPIIPPTVLAFADNGKVRDIMPRLAHLFNLPSRNEQGETYFYTLRRAKDTRLQRDSHTFVQGGVLKGDLILIEPTISLFEKLKKLDERANRLQQGIKPRIEYLLDLMPVLRQVQHIVEEDFKIGILYEWVNIDTIMLKRTPEGVAIFIAHRERPNYSDLFKSNILDGVRRLKKDEIVERTRSLNLLSPQQRRTGYTQYDSQYLTDKVYSLGATIYMFLMGQLPPVVETNTNLTFLFDQILNQSPEVCGPLGRVLIQAMHPEPRQRFKQPQQLLNALEDALQEWLDQHKIMENALAKMADPAQLEKAQAELQNLGPEYQRGWKVDKHLRRIDQSVESKRLSALAETKHAARQYAEELQILEELLRLTKDARLLRPIQDLRYQVNYDEAQKLARSNRPPDLMQALGLLQTLPPNYADTGRLIATVTGKLNKQRH
jgi:hypothetical protein